MPGGTLRSGELVFSGRSIDELQRITGELGDVEFELSWHWAFQDVRWAAECRVYSDFVSLMYVTAYAGTEKLATEQAVEVVVAALRATAIEPEVRATRTFSKGPGRSPQARADAKARAKADAT